MGTFLARVRSTFISGLLAILPIGITVYIIWFLYSLLDGLVGYNTPFGKLVRDNLGIWVPGLGIYLTLIIIFIIGLLVRNYVGSKLYTYLEKAIFSTPYIRKMYSTSKQIIDAVFNRDTSSFKKVVLVEYPRRDMYSIGFLTKDEVGRIQNSIGEKSVAVFLFTAPNPLSGWMLIVPEKDLIYLDMSIEEAFRMVISLGVSVPRRLLEGEGSLEENKEKENENKEK